MRNWGIFQFIGMFADANGMKDCCAIGMWDGGWGKVAFPL